LVDPLNPWSFRDVLVLNQKIIGADWLESKFINDRILIE
jgi:hypothetical protein